MQGTADILGHERLIESLWDVAARSKQHHAYLFEGPEGIGKRRVALRFAMALNCEARDSQPVEGTPCGQCQTCAEIEQGIHADVIWVEPEGKGVTRTIPVDRIREVIRVSGLHRYRARQRVIVIDPIDALNESGANALLKTLEAPPEGTGFLLLTSKASALLPTILSRCQRVRFGAVPYQRIADWLIAEHRVADATANRAALLAQGCPGVALTFTDEMLERRDEAKVALFDVLRGSAKDRFDYSESLTRGKRPDWMPRVEERLAILEEILRDVALCATGSDAPLLHPSDAEETRRWVAMLWPGGLQRCADAIHETRKQLSANVTGRTAVDALLSVLHEETRPTG